jgi:hypothetical protein
MPPDFTPAELKSWLTKLNDPATPQDELKRIVMELAHVDHPEALQALEQFRESPRAQEVEWIKQVFSEGRGAKSERRKAPVTLRFSPFAHGI